MPDYKKGKIYTIRCYNDTSLIYIGSTTQTLSQRWTDHKKNCSVEKYQNVLLYKKLNELGKDNFYIELYDEYPCENKIELEKKEGEITRQIGTLNQRVAGRSHEEYLKEEKDKVKISQQKYKNKHEEESKQYQSKYQNENKESIKQQRKQYRTTLITCTCGCSITLGAKFNHMRSKKHNELINLQ
jgi:hypothetical protein